jgi:hypothetical protein
MRFRSGSPASHKRIGRRPPYPRVGDPIFFESPAEWRAWLEAHHDSASDVWIGMDVLDARDDAREAP